MVFGDKPNIGIKTHMDFITFRSNALQGLAMMPLKEKKRAGLITKDDIEEWVKREYERHYGNL